MGFTTNLLNGLGAHLAGQAIGTWSATGVYSSGQTGIYLKVVPASPDAVIVLNTYPVSDDPSLSDSSIGVQIRTRAGVDPRTVDDTADAIFDALHGLAALTLGAIRVQQVRRTSYAQLGTDSNGRHERSDNYRFDLWRPSTHRT